MLPLIVTAPPVNCHARGRLFGAPRHHNSCDVLATNNQASGHAWNTTTTAWFCQCHASNRYSVSEPDDSPEGGHLAPTSPVSACQRLYRADQLPQHVKRKLLMAAVQQLHGGPHFIHQYVCTSAQQGPRAVFATTSRTFPPAPPLRVPDRPSHLARSCPQLPTELLAPCPGCEGPLGRAPGWQAQRA
jgi:hypothetical protein